MFGLGLIELIVLAFVAVLALGLPIAGVVAVLAVLRQRTGDENAALIAQLREENQRLRDELTALRAKNSVSA